jgi:hypothetical protein
MRKSNSPRKRSANHSLFILTLGATIQMFLSRLYGSSSLLVIVGISYLIASLWLLAALRYVTITEGELDACSLYRVLRSGFAFG